MKNINIKGPIVPNDESWIYELFDVEHTSPKSVADILKNANGEGVQLTVNSPGGDVDSASEIYTELRDYEGDVESRIVGLCASAASVIVMAGKVKMSPTGRLMIHNASAISIGDKNEMGKTSEMLEMVDKSIATAYQQKTRLSEDDLIKLMDAETWMDAEKAKEKGFVDEIMFEQTKVAASVEGMLPQKVIDKVRNDKGLNGTSASINVDISDEIKEAINTMQQQINDLKNQNKPEPKPTQNSWLF